MNIQEYISSGIIETYVLGMASPSEARKLEEMVEEYPEVRSALISCQKIMEEVAMIDQVTPPQGIKEKIKGELQNYIIPTGEKPETFIRGGFPTKVKVTRNNWLKYAAAASFIGLLISLWYNFHYQKLNREYAGELFRLKTEQVQLSSKDSLLKIITSPSMRTVFLEGVPAHPSSSAVVYWDAKTKSVYLALNNLPTPPKGRQYQLWAIVDGVPVDAGLYDIQNTEKIQQLKVITKAQMFAITLEPLGGSVKPTLSEMYAAGKI